MAYSDAQVAEAMAASLAQGFTLEQAIQGATQNYGISPEQATRAAVGQIYQQQLGRTPDPSGAEYYASQLAAGVSPQAIREAIARSQEGQNFLTQAITSAYRGDLGRNPEQEGYQYWQSLALANALSAEDIQAAVRAAAAIEQQQRGITGGITNFVSPDFEADPFGGRYATTNIFDLPADAVNVSTINGQRVQFVNPITQLAVISNFTNKGPGTTNQFTDAQVAAYLRDNAFANPTQVNEAVNMFGIKPEQVNRATELLAKNDPSINAATADYAAKIAANPQLALQNAQAVAGATRFSAAPGVETLSVPRVTEAVDRAFRAGSLTQNEYNQMMTSLTQATNPADIRKALATPTGSVVIDAVYGQQIGEDNDLNKALAEARQRQAVLSAQDPGYYQASDVLGRAYQAAGLDFPFMSDTYRANTMMTQGNVLNQQNFNQQVNQLLAALGQQFGGAETLQTPLTGQYYSETGLQPGFTPIGTEGTTFRSGVAGYTPNIPTGFQFGAPPVNATFQPYRPGAFQPEGVTTGGFITGYDANQQPIYSTYNNPNVNVGGVSSNLIPFVNQTEQFNQLMADFNARQAAIAAAQSGNVG